MAKQQHVNLHSYGDKSSVYAALQRDTERDSWIQVFWQVVFFGAALGGMYLAGHMEWLWLFVALLAVERSIAIYVDNSNRNWAMHVIDWIERTPVNSPT